MCIDGMGQSKFKIPRNVNPSKLWPIVWRPISHVSGVLVHGVGEYYYLADEDMRKDSNNNSELLARSLGHVTHALEMRGVPLPDHLSLQG